MKTLRYIGRYPVVPLFILLVMAFAGILAQWISPHDPELARVRDRIQPPAWEAAGSTEYLLGTDGLGRDILSRILYGARISLIVAAVTLGIGGTVGTVMGLLV